jgi:hypothetical protein
MKKHLLSIVMLIIAAVSLFSQAPQSFKYQAIARNGGGEVISNQDISIKVNLLQGNESGQVVYSETHTIRTNEYGLITLEIGNGSNLRGDFSKINWALSKYYVEIEIDINGGSDYVSMGISPLLSVPYALYAETSGNSSKEANSWSDGPNEVYVTNLTKNVAIGTTTANGILDIAGQYYFPNTSGSDGQILKTDGTGELSWQDMDIDGLSDGLTSSTSIFLGQGAGTSDDGSNNWCIGIGEGALYNNTNSDYNLAIGYNAAYSGTSAYGNTAIGSNTLYGVTTGDRNTAIGYAALYNNSKGLDNIAIGLKSSYLNEKGHYNIRIGNFSGFNNDGGSRNTIIGHNAGRGTSTHKKDGNVFLGYMAGYSETGSDKLYIENSNSTSPLIYGDFDRDLLRVNGTLNVNNEYSFPTTDGTDGQFLQTNGSGVLSWTSIGSSTYTINRALISDGSGNIAVSDVTATELGYLDGVTSSVQTQLDGKQASITGAATTITTLDLTPSRALISNSSGKVAVSDITNIELGYLDGVSSNVQTQLDGKTSSQWTTSGSDIYYSAGNVGIGTSASPTERLDVSGNIRATGTIRSGNSITIDGVNDKITASGGVLSFEDENLTTSGNIFASQLHPVGDNSSYVELESKVLSFYVNWSNMLHMDGNAREVVFNPHPDTYDNDWMIQSYDGSSIYDAVKFDQGEATLTLNQTDQYIIAGQDEQARLFLYADEGDDAADKWSIVSHGIGLYFQDTYSSKYLAFGYGTGVVVNESGDDDVDFRVESDTDENALFVDAGTGSVGIGVSSVSPSDKLHVQGNMRLTGSLKDKDGDTGTSGQLLSSTETGTDWIDAPSGGGGGAAVLSTQDVYTGANASSFSIDGKVNSSDELRASMIIPRSGTLKNLYAIPNKTTNAGSNSVMTIRVNGTDTDLTVTIPENSSSVASNLVNTVNVSAGDRLTVHFEETNGTASGANITASFLLE